VEDNFIIRLPVVRQEYSSHDHCCTEAMFCRLSLLTACTLGSFNEINAVIISYLSVVLCKSLTKRRRWVVSPPAS